MFEEIVSEKKLINYSKAIHKIGSTGFGGSEGL